MNRIRNRDKEWILIICGIVIMLTVFVIFYHGKVNQNSEAESDQEKAIGGSAVNIEIGKTLQKEFWTQTDIYPNNIYDTFVIDICLPDDYNETITYPVVYLTDCYWRRQDYKAIKELYKSGATKEFILVGIGYPDDYDFKMIRRRDLVINPQNFLEMIVNGVIPYVESSYHIDPKDRTFCGSSFGGHFMIYSLCQSDGLTKNVFKNYILASPTFFQDSYGIYLAEFEERYNKRATTLNANVYLTVGGLEGDNDYQVPIKEFVERVQNREYSGLNLEYKVYEGKDHYTVWVPALLDGLEKYLAKS